MLRDSLLAQTPSKNLFLLADSTRKTPFQPPDLQIRNTKFKVALRVRLNDARCVCGPHRVFLTCRGHICEVYQPSWTLISIELPRPSADAKMFRHNYRCLCVSCDPPEILVLSFFPRNYCQPSKRKVQGLRWYLRLLSLLCSIRGWISSSSLCRRAR